MAQATFSCPFGAIHLEDRRGTPQSDRRRSRPVLHVGLPPDPITGDASQGPFLASGAGRAGDCCPFCAAAADRAVSGKPGKLDEENAPGASSRRGGSKKRADGDIRPYSQYSNLSVGADVSLARCQRQAKQHGTSQADRKKRNEVSHKVLCHAFFQESVPWAKQPAAGAAEFSICVGVPF